MTIDRGKFIVLYGSNNLGKSTQAKLLVQNLHNYGYSAEYIKYPIYDLEPTGPLLDKILRGGEKQTISELELQQIYVNNRADYQTEVEKKLNRGIHIVAEDYIGTGLAWGVTKGADLNTLVKQNEGLLKEDLAILLDGERFIQGREEKHIHEQSDELMDKNREIHLKLAKKFGWTILPANASIEDVQSKIWEIVEQKIS